MSEKKVSLGSIIGGALLLCVGLFVLIKQDAFVKIVVICASIAAFVDGVYTLYEFREWKFVGVTRNLTLTKGILMVLSGIIGVFLPLFAAQAVVTVVVYVFAAMLLYSAFVSVENAIILKKINNEIPRGHFYVEAAFSALVSVIFFSDPSKILSAFVVIIGVTAVVVGIGFVILGILKKN